MFVNVSWNIWAHPVLVHIISILESTVVKDWRDLVCPWADTQSDPDFSIVARVEAFIAGWGLDEALKRSEAYLNAGADAILMHSKKSDPSDIESFIKAWNNQVC